jgi:hypothetical protein
MKKKILGFVASLVCFAFVSAFAQEPTRSPRDRAMEDLEGAERGIYQHSLEHSPRPSQTDLSGYPATLPCPPTTNVVMNARRTSAPWNQYPTGTDLEFTNAAVGNSGGRQELQCVYQTGFDLHTFVPAGACVLDPDGRTFRCKQNVD